MSNTVLIEYGDCNPVRDAAAAYLDRGWVPNPTAAKRAILSGWPELTVTDVRSRLAELWPEGTDRGIGLLLGTPSGGLVDVDCDCPEARRAAGVLLPATGMKWGRVSAPDSHHGFVADDPPAKAATRYADPVTGQSIVELRSTGAQTCVPPTQLPVKVGTGSEPVIWCDGAMGQPAAVTITGLGRIVACVAAAALLARYWPGSGGRHDAHLALAGGLVRSGLPVAEVEALVRAVCAATGDDEIDDRIGCVASTAARMDAGDTTGWPTLIGLLGEHGAAVVAAARRWLGADGNHSAAQNSNSTGPDRVTAVGDITLTASFYRPGQALVVAARGSEPLHRDIIRLDADAARRRYITALVAAAWPDEANRPAEVSHELAAALLGFAADPPRPTDAPTAGGAAPYDPYADPRPAALAEMDAGVVAEAEALLRDPRLIDRLAADIATIGVAGERNLARTLYLVGVSVQLPRPLSAIIIGSTSSGKSYTINSVAELIPPEVKLVTTDITANALYYLPEGSLHHRLVIGGERSRIEDDHRAETKRALREMLESQVLTKTVAVTTDGAPETVHIVRRGPIAYVESTTNADVFDEDRNRGLSLYTDESQEQTRAILRQTARRAAGERGADASRVVAVHHAVHRLLPRRDVVVPFAPEIESGYPDQRVDARRAFRHLIQMVKAVALLHFRQRERDEDGQVIATRDDYRLAVELAEVPLAVAAGALSAGARAFYGKLSAKFTPEVGFTTTEATDATKCPKSSTHRHLSELAEACLVEVTRGGAGRGDLWRRTTRSAPTVVTLPVLDGEGADPGVEAVGTAGPPPRRVPVGPAPWAS